MGWIRGAVVVGLVTGCSVDVDDKPGAFASASGSATTTLTTTEQGTDEESDEGPQETGSNESSSSDSDASTSGSTGEAGETCGDGVANAGEDCDAGDLAGQTCVGMGFGGGELACAPDCSFDIAGCHDCGDGVKNGEEQCDGNDLGGWNCTQLGWDQGTLACTMMCIYDTSGCEDAPCASEGQPCSDADDCCNTGCGKGGAFCITNNQAVCCS